MHATHSASADQLSRPHNECSGAPSGSASTEWMGITTRIAMPVASAYPARINQIETGKGLRMGVQLAKLLH